MGRGGTAALACIACALAALPSAAGAQTVTKIVFASDRDGTYDIWSMNPDGSGQTKLAGTPTADEFSPTPSPDGTKIAFIRGIGAIGGEPEGDLMIMNSDGTGERFVTYGANDPSWSPAGDKLSFGSIGHSSRDGEVWKLNADGSNATSIILRGRDNLGTSWSPDGQKIAFHAQIGDAFPQYEGVWTVKPDGTDPVQLTHSEESGDANPDWSPDGTKIAFDRYGAITLMNADGSSPLRLTDGPDFDSAWSPDGQQIAFYRHWADDEIYVGPPVPNVPTRLTDNPASDIDPDWLRTYIGYARPKGATPFRAALAIAYRRCTASDRTHGPPLAFPACSGPQQASDYLTVGTGDSNGMPARNEGSLRLDAMLGNPATPADEADVRVESFMDDVHRKAGLDDYPGELRTVFTFRITDRDVDGPAPNNGTTADAPMAVDTPCVPVAGSEGSTCANTTSMEALIPGSVKEGKRAIWAASRIELYDGGADDLGATTADNTLFATQGLFIP